MRALYLVIGVLWTINAFGQKNYKLIFDDQSYQQFIKHPKTEFKDSTAAAKYMEEFQYKAISDGYLLASFDTVIYQPGSALINFYLGPKMRSAQITINEEELGFLRKKSNINEKFISRIPFNPRELNSALQKIQETYLDNGYPFVRMQLKEIAIEEDGMIGTLEIKRGQFYRWTEIHVKGDSSISVKYISNLISIRKDDIYNETEIKKITSRINQISFLREIKRAEVLYKRMVLNYLSIWNRCL